MAADRNKKTRIIIILSLLALIFQGVWFLKHLGYIDFNLPQNSQSSGFATILEMKTTLKYQNPSEKIWKDAQVNQKLQRYDQVMTDGNSTAVIELEDKTLLTLSPNTLMILDRVESENNQAIRINIQRGRVTAKANKDSVLLSTQQGNIQLGSQSEIQLQSQSGLPSEVRLNQGDAQLVKKDGSFQQLVPQQLASVNADASYSIATIDKSVQLKGPEVKKVYVSKNGKASIPLTWTGSAQKVLLKKSSSDSIQPQVSQVAVGRQKQSTDLKLEEGNYSVALITPAGQSETQWIQVIPIEPLKIFSPKDRERFKTNTPIKFSWGQQPEAKEFRILFTNVKNKKVFSETNLTGFFEKSFSVPMDLSWRIESIDEEGQVISMTPPQSISIGDQFLEAPKLKSLELRNPASLGRPTPKAKTIEIRKPAAKSKSEPKSEIPRTLPPKKPSSDRIDFRWRNISVLAKLIFKMGVQTARAAESSDPEKTPAKVSPVEAVFRWETVPGARSYTIEISKTEDFRSPSVYKKVGSPEFIWVNFEDGTYYWRVAAGDERNQLGLFSDPAKILLKKSEAKDSLDPETAFSEGVFIRRRPDLESYQLPVDTKTESLLKEVPGQSFDEKRFDKKLPLGHQDPREIEDSLIFNLQAGSSEWTLNGPDQIKAKMKASSVNAFHFQMEKSISPKNSLMADVFYSRIKWEPSQVSAYENEKYMTDAKVQVLWGDSNSHLRRGLMVSLIPSIAKSGNQVTLKQVTAAGPSALYQSKVSERWSLSHQLSIIAGASSVSINSQNNFNFSLAQWRDSHLILGVGINGDLFFVDRSFSQGLSGGINFGLGF